MIRWTAVIAVPLGLGACASEHRPARSAAPAEGLEITALEISRSSARSAWDVLRGRVSLLSLSEDVPGRPLELSLRGAPSPPLVVLDGVPLHGLEVLRSIPAADILRIRIYSAAAAPAGYASAASGGLVVIESRGR